MVDFKMTTQINRTTNQIKIEDIQPEVFQELLRFIYTRRVSTATMETMAAGLFIAADKYSPNELKNECENYLIHDMSPDNCIELLLNFNLMNSAELLKKEAAKSFLSAFDGDQSIANVGKSHGHHLAAGFSVLELHEDKKLIWG